MARKLSLQEDFPETSKDFLGLLNHPIWASIEEDIAFGREPFCTGQKTCFMLFAFCFLLYAFVRAMLFVLSHPLGRVNGFVKP